MPSIPAAVYWIVFLLLNTYHSCFWHLPEVIDYRETLTSANDKFSGTHINSNDTKGRSASLLTLSQAIAPLGIHNSGLTFGMCNSHMQSCANWVVRLVVISNYEASRLVVGTKECPTGTHC